MSIRAMGVRSALRTAQSENLASPGPVVSGIGTTLPGQPVGADQPPATPPDENVEAPPKPQKRNPVSEYLDSVSAWIPSEAVGLFLAFAGFFTVFNDTAKELVLAAVVALATMAYAAKTSVGAHKMRGLKTGAKKAVITALIALVAFGAWWFATPGSFAYDEQELGLDPFWPAIVLAVVALGIPFPAGWFGVEPLRSSKPE